MKIVGIGGGTGLPVLLRGLKSLDEEGEEPLDITAIVAVSDNGGSSGALRQAFGIPAVGDIRNCIIALADDDSALASVCQYRFQKADGLRGHSVGNLILSALYEMSGDFGRAVRDASTVFNLRGRILPSTDIAVSLCAEYVDGSRAVGESNITGGTSSISRVWLDPAAPAPSAGVLDALASADIIVLGPGSLYTSIIPNLLVDGVASAIRESAAIKVYVCNLMTQAGETDGYTAADHVRALQSYLPPRTIDVCVVNTTTVGMGLAERYGKLGSMVVQSTVAEILRLDVIPAAAPLLSDGGVKVRHNAYMLARLIVSLARGITGTEKIICGKGNGR